jgi:hypothetical protein
MLAPRPRFRRAKFVSDVMVALALLSLLTVVGVLIAQAF